MSDGIYIMGYACATREWLEKFDAVVDDHTQDEMEFATNMITIMDEMRKEC